MNKMTYRTIIVKDGRGYHGYVPSLPGCHTDGMTIEETQKNLKEAMEGWLLTRLSHQWPIPEDTLIESLQTITIMPTQDSRLYA
ncbi:MAG: type II toxin-antitoxin system HicB family antitoxin [Patescibacteria group bacterium]